jgi:DNA-binding NtrC family response regulator
MAEAKRVLYIDDESDLLELAASFFEEENLPIDTCTDFEGALKLIRENSYEIIITDAKMPSGSGYDLYKIVKSENHFQGKFILVTGNIQTIGEENKHHFDLVIYKPLRFEELVSSVKKLLVL